MNNLIQITNDNFNKLVSIDSHDHYAPSVRSVELFEGWIDADGNLYRETSEGEFVKRTATNVNDERKSYRLCIDGEKFYISIDVDAAREEFAKLVKPKSAPEFAYAIYDEDDGAVEVCSKFASHDDALSELTESIDCYNCTGFYGVVYQVCGVVSRKKTYEPR